VLGLLWLLLVLLLLSPAAYCDAAAAAAADVTSEYSADAAPAQGPVCPASSEFCQAMLSALSPFPAAIAVYPRHC
jgi:hypothetical protein